MPKPTFEEVLEAAEVLNPAAQWRLRDLLSKSTKGI